MESTQNSQDLDQLNQIDPSTIQSLLAGSDGASLIPESLVTTLVVSFVVLNVLGVLFLIFYVFGIIRKWKVQSAVLRMQKDLADIKAQLASSPATLARDANQNDSHVRAAKPPGASNNSIS